MVQITRYLPRLLFPGSPAKDSRSMHGLGYTHFMKSEFTAIIEPAPEGGFWAICPEIPGANGQGESIEETRQSLIEAVELLLEDRRSDYLRGLPLDAIQEKILVG